MKPTTIAPIPAHPLLPDTAFLFSEGTGTTTCRLNDAATLGTLIGTPTPAWGSDASGAYVAVSNLSAGSCVSVPAGPAVNPTRYASGANVGTEAWSISVTFDFLDALTDAAFHPIVWKDGDYAVCYTGNSVAVLWWPTGGGNPYYIGAGGLVAGRNTLAFTVANNYCHELYVNGAFVIAGDTAHNNLGGFSGTTSLNPLTVGGCVNVNGFFGGPFTASTALRVRALYLYRRTLAAADARTLAADPFVFLSRPAVGHPVSVGTYNHWPAYASDATLANNGGAGNVRRTQLVVREAVNLRVLLPSSGGFDELPGASATYAAAVDHDGTHQVTWGGATTVTVTPGQSPPTSDPVVRPDGSPLVAPEGVVVGVNVYITTTGGIPLGVPTGYNRATSPAPPLFVATSTSIADGNDYSPTNKTMSGGIPGSNNLVVGPIALLGQMTATPLPCVGIVSDSIGAGQGDQGGEGFAADAFIDLSIPYFNCGMPGETAARFATTNAHRLDALAAVGITHCVVELGDNDIFGGATWQATRTALIACVAAIRIRFPGLPIAICTVNPRSSSPDGWTTTNQTTSTYEPQRRLLNADLRVNMADYGTGLTLLETATTVESSTDSGIYAAPGGVAYCLDGIHPTRAGHLAMGNPVKRQVTAWLAATSATVSAGPTLAQITAAVGPAVIWADTSSPSNGSKGAIVSALYTLLQTVNGVVTAIRAKTDALPVDPASGGAIAGQISAGVPAVLGSGTITGTTFSAAGLASVVNAMQAPGGSLAQTLALAGTANSSIGAVANTLAAGVSLTPSATTALLASLANRVVDGTVTDAQLKTLLLAWVAGSLAVTDNNDGTLTAIVRKRDGTTAALTLTYGKLTGVRAAAGTVGA